MSRDAVLDKLLRLVLNPQEAILRPWRTWGIGSFKLRLDYDIFPRPHYAYCVYHAARLAQRLGIERISLIEFGVAGGNGLLELEALAESVEGEFDTRIDIYGFDSGEGLPAPADYRDLPYIWQKGFFRMDVDALKRKLRRAKLVLGDVRDTVPAFFSGHDPAPIGAVFHDLDYYSSTHYALGILRVEPKWILPRVFCYCDDVLSSEFGGILCNRVGQLRALDEYNEVDPNRFIGPISGFKYLRRVPAAWNDKIYVHHTFDHPAYSTYVHTDADRQLHLNQR